MKLIPTTYAEPGPVFLYSREANTSEEQECGWLWFGDEHMEYIPTDSTWEEFMMLGENRVNVCMDLLEMVYTDTELEALNPESACDAFEISFDSPSDYYDESAICEHLGFNYKGEISAEGVLTEFGEEQLIQENTPDEEDVFEFRAEGNYLTIVVILSGIALIYAYLYRYHLRDAGK